MSSIKSSSEVIIFPQISQYRFYIKETHHLAIIYGWSMFFVFIFFSFGSFIRKAKLRKNRYQFHQHFTRALFVWKCFTQLFSYYVLALQLRKSFVKHFRTKNLRIKCWWNWHLKYPRGVRSQTEGLPLITVPLLTMQQYSAKLQIKEPNLTIQNVPSKN